MATPTIRLALNFVGTTKSSPTNGLTFASSTTATGTWTSAPSGIPKITTASRQYLPITVGTEIVWLYTYTTTTTNTTGKFLRGMEGTTKASHTKAPWGNNPTAWDGLLDGEARYKKPVTAYFETVPRVASGDFTNRLSTKKVFLTAIILPKGLTLGHLGGFVSNIGATSPHHWWFVLTDGSYNQLATTADQTTTAWGATTEKLLPVAKTATGTATSFSTTFAGVHYIGVCMTATTPVTLRGQAVAPTYSSTPPVGIKMSSTFTAGPPSFPKQYAAATKAGSPFYAFVGP